MNLREKFFKKNVFLIGTLFIALFSSFNIGPVRIGGWVGDKLDKAGSPLGLPGELLTAGAINNMHDKLNKSIDHLDIALAKNAKDAIGNLDSVLTAREDQFDSIMTKNINQFNDGIARNIALFDETLENSLAGVTFAEINAGKMFWDNTKAVAQYVLLSITVYFIFLTYNRYRSPNGFGFQEFLSFLKQIKVYLLVWLICIVIIILYTPLLSNFRDNNYEDRIKGIETDIRSAIVNNNFESAYRNARKLRIVKGENGESTYGYNKIGLIRQLFYNTSEQQQNESSLSEKFSSLQDNFIQFSINDPEFYIVSALFKKNFFNSKEGILLAAIDCIRFITYHEKYSNTLYELKLTPYVKDILNLYFLNPYEADILKEKLSENKQQLTDRQLEILQTGVYDLTNVISTPVVDFKDDLVKTIQSDQDDFFTFITSDYEGQQNVRKEILKRWRGIVKKQNELSFPKYYSNRMVLYNDFIVRCIIQTDRDPWTLHDSEHPELTNIAQQEYSKLEVQIVRDTSLAILGGVDLFYFKMSIVANNLINTKEPFARALKTKFAMNETEFYYQKVDSLLSFDEKFNNSRNRKDAVSNLTKCVELASQLNLFYKDPKTSKRIPLANYFADFSNVLLSNSEEDLVVKESLISLYRGNLEKNFYNF